MRADKPRQGREGRAASNSLGRTEGEKQRIREHKAASEGLECIPVAAVRAQPLTGSKDSLAGHRNVPRDQNKQCLIIHALPCLFVHLAPFQSLADEGIASGGRRSRGGRTLSVRRPSGQESLTSYGRRRSRLSDWLDLPFPNESRPKKYP